MCGVVRMDSHKLTEFGLQVKMELLRSGKEQKWLIEQIKDRGKYADSGYMYKIFTGQREAPEIKRIICEVLELPETK